MAFRAENAWQHPQQTYMPFSFFLYEHLCCQTFIHVLLCICCYMLVKKTILKYKVTEPTAFILVFGGFWMFDRCNVCFNNLYSRCLWTNMRTCIPSTTPFLFIF
ncbi:hypothetical protein Z043_122296 [Scleropages formosus]|uniref:Uncharacterized protein n=1 Tax=Scleropages formosus TaxID=113540 RepID=A0A0P7TG05_SCLFO|nr:hypothetical protein Z043_122296 [Scleropages formosus]